MLRTVRTLALLFALAHAARAQESLPGRVVAVTIDDLPVTGPTVTRPWDSLTAQLLAALARHAVPAVGFVNESKLYAAGRLDSTRVVLLEAWLAAGHELGNHTFSHPSAHQAPLADYLRDISRGEAITRALTRRTGRPLRYFRHPQLHTGRTLAYRRAVEKFLARRGYTVAPVTVDNQEWVYAAAYAAARRRGDSTLASRVVTDYLRHVDTVFAYSESLARSLFGREMALVLLLHANELNADHLDHVLRQIRDRGYRFARLDEALADPAYRSADEYVGPRGLSWLQRWALTRDLTPPTEPREESYVAELVAVLAARTATGSAQQAEPLGRLGWLAGCWELKRGPRTTLEMWMPPAGGLMLGASRTTADGVVREFEHVRLRADGSRLVYTALPSGQAMASFTSTDISDSGFTVENLQHDFPQRIVYKRRGADSLVARIEGPGDGGTRSFEFPMRRVSCTSE